jgi:hypothetical protein
LASVNYPRESLKGLNGKALQMGTKKYFVQRRKSEVQKAAISGVRFWR